MTSILLHQKEQQIPGSVQYLINRYHKHAQWNLDDMGMLMYHYKKEEPKENYYRIAVLCGWQRVL